jgi:curli biogenesis system outer membrane secretion channel CsgG
MKKIMVVALLLAVLLSACGTPAATSTPAPTSQTVVSRHRRNRPRP